VIGDYQLWRGERAATLGSCIVWGLGLQMKRRGVLILFAAVAIIASLATWSALAIRRIRERDSYVAQLERSGVATIEFRRARRAGTGSWASAWLESLTGARLFSEVSAISWYGGNEGLGGIRLLDSVEELYLGNGNVSDKGLESLPCLPRLRRLDIYGLRMTNEAMAVMKKFPRLEVVELGNIGISDEGVACLSVCPELRVVSLRETLVTDAALEVLASLENLEQLDLRDTGITDDGLIALRTALKLEFLRVDGTNVSDRGLKHLIALPALNVLYVPEATCTERIVDEFGKRLPSVEVVRVPKW
jgi:hypothetical protein